MKHKLILLVVLIISSHLVKAQACDIQIQILENKYMFGKVEKIESSATVKRLEVNFSSEYMEVIMPHDNQNYLIKVVNEDCQAYCSRAKRIRQLHSGDEKIVRNLFKDKKEDILAQLQACNL